MFIIQSLVIPVKVGIQPVICRHSRMPASVGMTPGTPQPLKYFQLWQRQQFGGIAAGIIGLYIAYIVLDLSVQLSAAVATLSLCSVLGFSSAGLSTGGMQNG